MTQVLPQRLQHALLALAIETVVGIVNQNHLSLVQKAMGSGQQIQISLENAAERRGFQLTAVAEHKNVEILLWLPAQTGEHCFVFRVVRDFCIEYRMQKTIFCVVGL